MISTLRGRRLRTRPASQRTCRRELAEVGVHACSSNRCSYTGVTRNSQSWVWSCCAFMAGNSAVLRWASRDRRCRFHVDAARLFGGHAPMAVSLRATRTPWRSARSAIIITGDEAIRLEHGAVADRTTFAIARQCRRCANVGSRARVDEVVQTRSRIGEIDMAVALHHAPSRCARPGIIFNGVAAAGLAEVGDGGERPRPSRCRLLALLLADALGIARPACFNPADVVLIDFSGTGAGRPRGRAVTTNVLMS